MPAAWIMVDGNGHQLPGLTGESRIALGRRALPGRYDPFRLHVSASYREMFERDLGRLLTLRGWQMVRTKPRRRAARAQHDFTPYRKAA